MAYEVANPIKLIAGGVGGAPAIWSYVDGDALGSIDASGYFDLEANRLAVGDWILARGNSVNGIGIVVSNSGGVVDTSNFTSITIDSD